MRKDLLELIGIGFSIAGTTITLINSKPAYSTIPITATLGISYINRRQEREEYDQLHTLKVESKQVLAQLKNKRKESSETRSIPEKQSTSKSLSFNQQEVDSQQLETEKTKKSSTEFRISSLEKSIEHIEEYIENIESDNLKTIGNQLKNSINNNYNYDIIEGRSKSRQVLFEALNKAEEELIIVCPWLGFGFDDNVIGSCERLLEKNVTLRIGWGQNSDIEDDRLEVKMNQNSYKLYNLKNTYPENLNVKLLGTHEKFLVCDRSFAFLGSHNFLTSKHREKEREVGIKTNDPRIIDQLKQLFYNAEDLSKNESSNSRLPIVDSEGFENQIGESINLDD